MKKEKFLKLLSRKLSRQISAADSEDFDRAVESNEEYRLLTNELGRYFDHGRISDPKIDQLKHIWERITSAEENNCRGKIDYSVPQKTGFRYAEALKVAAVLLIITCLGILGYHLVDQPDQSFQTVAATDRKTFKVLDDGTKIWVNKKSTISYNKSFGSQKREIFLDGEAYFDVVKNDSIPLIIHAGNLDIEVKGTAFNVNAYKRNPSIFVALVRGSIEITERLDKKNRILLKPNEKLIVSNTIKREDNNCFSVLRMDSGALLSQTRWTSDTLAFHKEKLQDLAVRMEKKYDVKIEVQSDQLNEKRFSGTFTKETIQQALEALKLSYPLTYTISNRLVIIKDRR